MTSRNKLQGRYAGCFRGQHCRTRNVVGKKYILDHSYCKLAFVHLPKKLAAWGIIEARKFKMIVAKITRLEEL